MGPFKKLYEKRFIFRTLWLFCSTQLYEKNTVI